MHAYIRFLSSRVSPEYRLSTGWVIYTVSDPPHIADVNNTINLCLPEPQKACVLIKQKSALENVFSLVTVLLKYED